jgi:capsular polysaccharide transport system permease protein
MSVAKPRLFNLMTALILRETRGRYGRRQIGYVWALIEPGMYVMIAMTIFTITGREVMSEWPMPLFILTGMGPWMLFFRTDNYVRHCYGGIASLLYHPVLVPAHFMISQWLIETATVVTFVIIAFFIYGLFWDEPRAIPRFLAPVVFACIVAVLFGLGVGGSLAPLMVRWPGFAYVLGLFVRVLFLTSGVFYIPDYAPPLYKPVVYMNPMTHVIALFRQGFSAAYPAAGLDMGYALFVSLALIFVAFLLERFFVRHWAAH